MAGYVDAILAGLSGESKRLQAQNPFLAFADGLGGQDYSGLKLSGPQAAMIAGIGGIAKGFGASQYDRQMQDFSQELMQALASEDPTAAVQANPALARYATPFIVADYGQRVADKNEARKAQREFTQNVLQETIKGVIDNPYRADKIKGAVGEMLGAGGAGGAGATGAAAPTNLDTPAAESPATSLPPARTAGPAYEGSKPSRYEEYLNLYEGDETLARDMVKRDSEMPLKQEEALTDLRKEFTALPEVRSFVQSDIGYKSLLKAVKDDSAMADLELIRGAIQAIEPGMAVREGEAADVVQSMGLFGQWSGTVARALRGESRLTPDARKGILRIAKRRFEEYSAKYQRAKDFYQGQAQRRGLPDAEAITYLGDIQGVGDSTQEQEVPDLQSLARQFPNTEAGRAAFKAKVAELRGGGM